MGFFSDSQLSPLEPTTPSPGDPILLNRPRAVTAYERKLSEVYPALFAQGVDPSLINPMIDLDARSVERGQNPMSTAQTLTAIRAATPTPDSPFGQAINPVPERGTSILDIPANAVADLRTIFTSIPKLPAALWKQVQELPDAPEKLSEAIKDPGKLDEVPGLNLIPGVYTLSNILGGTPEELMRHPLMTALDVTPYARARVFDAPASMLDDAGNLVRRVDKYKELFPEMQLTQRAINRELGRNMLGDTGKVSIVDLAANTRAGRALGEIKDRAKISAAGTRVGQEAQAALSRNARATIIKRNQLTQLTSDVVMNPNSIAWQDPGVRRMLGNVLGVDHPAIKLLHELEADFGDDFGKATYGSADNWAKRRQEIGFDIQHNPDKINDFTDAEKEYVTRAEAVSDQLIKPYTSTSLEREAPFGEVTFTLEDGTPYTEILPYAQASDIWKARARIAEAEELKFLHQLISDDKFRAEYSEQQIIDRALTSDVLSSPNASNASKDQVIAGYVHALTAKGLNARPFLTELRRRPPGRLSVDSVTELTRLSERLPPGLDPPMTFDQLDEAIIPRYADARTASGFRRTVVAEPLRELRGLLHSRPPDLTLLRKRFDEIFDRVRDGKIDPEHVPESFRALDRDVVDRSIEMMRERRNWTATNAKTGSDTYLRALNRNLTGIEKRSAPARFFPKFGDIVGDRMTELARELTDEFMADTPEAGERLVEAVRGGNIGRLDELLPRLDPEHEFYNRSAAQLFSRFGTEARNSWQELVEAGFDPKFVHHVPVGKTGRTKFASINLSAKKPGSWNRRTLNMVPSEMDLALSLRGNAIDFLTKKMEDHFIDVITKGSETEGIMRIARSKTELLNSLEGRIDAEMQRQGGRVSRQAIAEDVLNRYYTPFDAQRLRNMPTSEGQAAYRSGARVVPGKLTGSGATEQLYIPKSLGRLFDQIATPQTARAIWDPVMGTFRTATLVLSPRWQIYNLLGNGLTGVMSGGFDFLKELPKSIDIIRRARRFEATPEIGLGVRGSLGEAFRPEVELRELTSEGFEQLAQGVLGKNAETVTRWGKPIGKGMTATQDFLVRMNAMVDDVTRISNYLVGEKKAMKALTPEVMEAAETIAKRSGSKAPTVLDMRRVEAENLMRDWTYNWDSMTPWERSTARFIFPFYGFFSHILRYSYRYAVDHPFRVAVAAAFARNELADWGTGLPERIHDMLLVGERDEHGNQLGLNFGGWSPFADTANLFSLTGWMSQVNPMITTLAQQFGIDPRTGEAGVYPNTSYDPVTGRLSIAPPNVVTSFIKNLIPQTQGISMLLGGEKELRATNPDAAGRQLLSSFGVPVLARQVNVPQEIAQAELARENASRQALSAALSSGSTAPVRAYPQLSKQVTLLQTYQAQNPTQFAQMTRGLTPEGYLDLAQRALIPRG